MIGQRANTRHGMNAAADGGRAVSDRAVSDQQGNTMNAAAHGGSNLRADRAYK